jgi:hypothetical protein
MVSSGLLCREFLGRTDVSEEPGASFIRMTKIGELGTFVQGRLEICLIKIKNEN